MASAQSPQVETSSTLYLDYADNPQLQSIFATKNEGDDCTLKFDVTIMAKQPEGVQLSINKIITEGEYDPEEQGEGEVEPTAQEPVMATMKRSSKGMGMMDTGSDNESY